MKEDKKNTIHVDTKPHQTDEQSLSGAEIKRLGGVAGDYDLWLVVPGPGGDRLIKDDEQVELKSGMHFVSAPSDINPGQ